MKRWAIVILNLILCLSINSVFADEDVDFYDDELEIQTGSITINFLAGTNIDDEDSCSSLVKGMNITLYRLDSGNLVKVGDYVSNDNGVVYIDNLQYGLYKYQITEAPAGIEADTDMKKVELTIEDSDVVVNNYSKMEVYLADNVTEEETKEDEENTIEVKTDTNEEAITNENVEVVKTTDSKEAEDNFSSSKVNTMANDIYNTTASTEIVTSSDKDFEINTIAKMMEEENKKNDIKMDVISAMKDVRITDTIREAVVSNSNDMYKTYMYADILDKDRFRKKYRKVETTQKIAMKYRAYKNNVYANITRAIRIA